MTSRNIKAVIEVGGQVAASLPSATRRARAELQSLEQAQQGDVRQLRSLRQSLSYVSEGSETYNRRLQEIGQTQEGLDYRTDKIIQAREALQGAGGEAGGFRGRMMQVRAVLGPVGIAVGAATGLIVGLASAFRGAGRQGNELINTAALYGQTVEDIQKRRNLFQYFTQDAGTAQAAARNLLDVSEQFQRVRFGAGAGPDQFLAAQRLGFDPADLIQGQLNQRQIIEQAIAGVQGLPDVEARLRLEQLGLSEDVRAAVLVGTKEGLEAALVYQARQAVLSEEQLAANRDMGRNIDEILTQIGRLVQITLSGIAPPLLSMSTAILGWLAGPEGALRGERQELEFRRGEVQERRDAELEERRRDAARNRPAAALANPAEALAGDRSSTELPKSAPSLATGRELPKSAPSLATGRELPKSAPSLATGRELPKSARRWRRAGRPKSAPSLATGRELPKSAPSLATGRELAGIDDRIAEIDARLATFRSIDLAGKYPGPLGNIPGAPQLAERGVSAGGLAMSALQGNLAVELAPLLGEAFGGALRDFAGAGLGQPVNQTITNNITNNSGDDIGQKILDALAQNPYQP